MSLSKTLPYDKILHCLAGVIIFAAFNFLFTWQVGLIASFTIGALKEIWDKISGKGTPDLLDFLVTGVGGVLGFLCVVKNII